MCFDVSTEQDVVQSVRWRKQSSPAGYFAGRAGKKIGLYEISDEDVMYDDVDKSVTSELRSRRGVDSDKIKMLKQRYALNFRGTRIETFWHYLIKVDRVDGFD